MTDYIIDNKFLYNIQYRFITYFNYILRIVLVLYIVGALNSNISFLLKINLYVKMFIALFLIYRFNRWRHIKVTFTDLDREIAFSAGLYIFVLSFTDYIIAIGKNSRMIVGKHLRTFTDQVLFIKRYTLQFLQIPNPLEKTIT